MQLAAFAFLDNAQKSVQQFLHNCLLVAGAFLVGYILGGVIGWALGKWAFGQKDPTTLKQVSRPIGGIILAFIVALLVFTGMGKPFGEGGEGKGTPNDSGNKDTQSPDRNTVNPNLTPHTELKPADRYFRITILEGNDVPSAGRFYQLEDGQVKTLEELKPLILEAKSREKGKIALAIQFRKNTPPGDPRLVTNLTHWATEEAGLDVTFPASR